MIFEGSLQLGVRCGVLEVWSLQLDVGCRMKGRLLRMRSIKGQASYFCTTTPPATGNRTPNQGDVSIFGMSAPPRHPAPEIWDQY